MVVRIDTVRIDRKVKASNRYRSYRSTWVRFSEVRIDQVLVRLNVHRIDGIDMKKFFVSINVGSIRKGNSNCGILVRIDRLGIDTKKAFEMDTLGVGFVDVKSWIRRKRLKWHEVMDSTWM